MILIIQREKKATRIAIRFHLMITFALPTISDCPAEKI